MCEHLLEPGWSARGLTRQTGAKSETGDLRWAKSAPPRFLLFSVFFQCNVLKLSSDKLALEIIRQPLCQCKTVRAQKKKSGIFQIGLALA